MLVVLLLPVPPVGAVSASLELPGPVPVDGTPFDVHLTLEGLPDEHVAPVEVKLWLGGEGWQASRTWNGTAFERSDRYVLEVPVQEDRWSGWVPLRANPTSRNHDRLTQEELIVGLKARSSEGIAKASAPVDAILAPEHRLVGAMPGTVIEVVDETGLIARRGHHGAVPQVIELAVPSGFEGRICTAKACPTGEGLVLDRVGPESARLRNLGETAVDLSTGVVVLEAARCVLSGSLPPGGTLSIEASENETADQGSTAYPCQGASERGAWRPGRLWFAGHVVDEAPDPPGWGQAVRQAWAPHGWAPWRLPHGVEPAPVRWQHVEGAIDGFATQREGLTRVLEVVHGARERLSVATYLFTNERVADALVAAQARGVDVTVLLEPTPVGGLPDAEQAIMRRLEASGIEVRWLGGALHRHGLQHAKVIVADGAVALVITENLTHSGLPADGDGNLGLGVGVANATLARRIETILGFEGPSIPWHPAGWRSFSGRIMVLSSPENAWSDQGVPAWLEHAGRVDALVLRVSPDWGARPNAWLEALTEVSRSRPVRVLASGIPEGARRANQLGLSALAGSPRAGEVEVRLSGPSVGTVHAKAMLGGSSVLVGSSNWGLGGVLLNREVDLIVEDAELARELGAVFDHAWNGTASDQPRLPVGAPGGLLAAGTTVLASMIAADWRWARARGSTGLKRGGRTGEG